MLFCVCFDALLPLNLIRLRTCTFKMHLQLNFSSQRTSQRVSDCAKLDKRFPERIRQSSKYKSRIICVQYRGGGGGGGGGGSSRVP